MIKMWWHQRNTFPQYSILGNYYESNNELVKNYPTESPNEFIDWRHQLQIWDLAYNLLKINNEFILDDLTKLFCVICFSWFCPRIDGTSTGLFYFLLCLIFFGFFYENYQKINKEYNYLKNLFHEHDIVIIREMKDDVNHYEKSKYRDNRKKLLSLSPRITNFATYPLHLIKWLFRKIVT